MSPGKGWYGCARGDGAHPYRYGARFGCMNGCEGKVSMAQNEQNWDRENADDQLNEQVTPWSQRAFADDAVEDPAGESAGESAGDSAVEEGSLSFSDAPAEDLEDLEHNTRIYINRIYSRYAFIWDEVSEEADRRFHELIETEYSEYALSIVERLQQQEKDNGFEIKKKTMDQGYFDMDLDIDDWLTKRAAIQQEINQSEERLSDLQIKELQAKKKESW